MNFQVSGRSNEVLSQIDSKVATDNEQQIKFKQALHNFVGDILSIFGNASQVTIFGDGTVDHGGANLGMQVSVLNYQDDKLDKEGNPIQTETTQDK